MTRTIVITGGIGSGKSEVCRQLALRGYTNQYDADSRVKALYSLVPELVPSIEKSLGMNLRGEDGRFVPELLAGRIFSDREALLRVESIVFPVLMEDFNSFCSGLDTASGEEQVVLCESATVLEKTFFNNLFDSVILVSAPFRLRLERACRRDASTQEKILSRMNNQKLINFLSDSESGCWGVSEETVEQVRKRISAVIDSDCSLEELGIRAEKAVKYALTKML